MGNTARGKHALFISDRSGLQFPYTEMVREWNGSRVHTSEYEPKQPQLEPKPFTADPQGLMNPRPAAIQLPTTDFLPQNPFTITASSTQVSVSFPNSNYSNGDYVRFQRISAPIGGVPITTLELETTLNGNITATDNSITLTDSSALPLQGYIMIEKINSVTGLYANEVIYYNGNSGNVLSNCVRGTNAPFRGLVPVNTTAVSHDSGAKVVGAYLITLIPTTVLSTGQPSSFTVYNSFTFNLISAASSSEIGGGLQTLSGPVNNK